MKYFLLFAASFFLPFVCLADSRIKIRLVYSQGVDSLEPAEFVQFSIDLRKYLQREISPRIRIFRTTANLPDLTQLDVDRPLFDRLTTYSTINYDLVHAVLPPTSYNAKQYVQGWSYGVCTRSPHTVSYSTAMVYNANKYSLYYESLTAAAHEIVHQLGGQHRSGGLMRSDILLDAHEGIPLPSRSTLADVRRCGK